MARMMRGVSLKIRTRLVLACTVQMGLLLALLGWQWAAEQAQLQLAALSALPRDSGEAAVQWLALAPPAAGLGDAAGAAGSPGPNGPNGPRGPQEAQGAPQAQASLSRAQAWVQGLALALMGTCLWLALSLDRAVRQPLQRLRHWADRMRAGDLDSRSSLRGGSEFAELSAAIDQMAGTVADSMQQLRDEVQRRQAAEEALRQLAFHDALTGLPTQRLLRDRLEGALARARRDYRSLTLMFLDLDGFKPVNDGHGHDVGDRLLQDVAQRLRDAVRECDTVARLGGDEFVILLPELGDPAAAQALKRKLQARLAQPTCVCGCQTPLRPEASIGVAMYPQDGVDAETLLRAADQDMYRNKSMRKLLDRLG